MKRRDFVKYGTITSSGVVFVNSVLGCVNPDLRREVIASESDKIEKLYRAVLKSNVSISGSSNIE